MHIPDDVDKTICERCGVENPAISCTRYGQVCAHCQGDIKTIYKPDSIIDKLKKIAGIK